MSSGFGAVADGGWGFRRLTVFMAADNVGSRRVCERLGLRLEVRARRERYIEPFGYHDVLGFAVLDDEWDFDAHRAKPGIGWND
jgi:RimJ/RimL family protein N-acetyltransferase